jgi:hypothetical protein
MIRDRVDRIRSLACAEGRFGDVPAAHPAQGVADNCSSHTTRDKVYFSDGTEPLRLLNPIAKLKISSVCETFVKTLKRDYDR